MKFICLRILLFSFCLCFWSVRITWAQKHIGEKKLYYGASYYPEAWPAENIDEDISRMKTLRMNVVRMGEFAWSSMETSSGVYDFKWLHEVIGKLHKAGISTILGTPTATPPAWLIEKYPDILRTNGDGTKQQHGARKDYSFSSAQYRREMVRFIEQMAKEFGNKPGVIAWQTDNEFSLHPDYSNETKTRWHQWLSIKYKTIGELNTRWNTALWSQHYASFDQVPMPADRVWHNPSLRWCWQIFSSDEVVSFQELQIKAIRKYSKLPITHDGTPGNKLDFEKLFANLDFMAVNNYHSFEAYARVVSNYDRMRGYQKGYHWLFETAPNNSGGGPEGMTWNIHQPVGSIKAALWMNYALGGQGAMYWPWRQHWAGHEMVHGAVISAWNKPAANYNDLKELGKELEAASAFLMNTPVAPAEIAVVYSHESVMAFGIEQYVNGIKYYNDWTNKFFLPIQKAQLHRDVIGFNSDMSVYKVLFMPLCPYVPQHFRNALKTWVERGGTLIMGPMTGYRTEDFTSFQDYATGDFEKWMGIQVESRVPIGLTKNASEEAVALKGSNHFSIASAMPTLWSEALTTKTGKVLASYQQGTQHNLPAIIENQVGRGRVIYLGTDPGEEAIRSLVQKYALALNIKPTINEIEGVVAVPRKGKEKTGLVLVNITREKKQIQVGTRSVDVLTGAQEANNIELMPYQTKVLEFKR